jgi:hypothetical protein
MRALHDDRPVAPRHGVELETRQVPKSLVSRGPLMLHSEGPRTEHGSRFVRSGMTW